MISLVGNKNKRLKRDHRRLPILSSPSLPEAPDLALRHEVLQRRTQHTGATKLQAKHHPSDRQTTAHQATTTQRSKEKQGGDQASFSQDNAKGNRRSSRVPILLISSSSPRKTFWKETVQPLRGRCHVLVRLRPHGFEDTKNPW